MVQVAKNHYYFHNVKPHRFQLYWWVIKETLTVHPSSVLEVGPGQGVVHSVLKFNGVSVITADFDISLRPSVVCDIRRLPFKNMSFDVVVASEVLEHIPWEQVMSAFRELKRCARRALIISVPYNQHHVSININVKVNKWLGFKGVLNRVITRYFPLEIYAGKDINRRFVFDGEHYWELGYQGHKLKDFIAKISREAKSLKHYRVPMSPYHYMFVVYL